MQSTKLEFQKQVIRIDVLHNMLHFCEYKKHYDVKHVTLSGVQLFNLIMQESKDTCDERRQGWLFETLCQILILVKCMKIKYTHVFDGQLQSLKQVSNIQTLLKIKIEGGGNNIVDMIIKQDLTFILFSMKYKNKLSETDVSKIDNTIKTQNLMTDFKIALIVKDRSLVTKHKYKNKCNIDKQLHDEICVNNMLFDEKDVIQALDVFCSRYADNILNITDFMDMINSTCLYSSRQQLIQKLHQRMTLLKFMKSLSNQQNRFCISHKPRSGKSITMLLICMYLLKHEYNKILIMTSVPATINNFIQDLDTYIDFKDISYKTQDDFANIHETFHGIVFCSVQYLKMNGNKKKTLLKQLGFDAIIADESHKGSSTYKTKAGILEVDPDVEDIRRTIKLNIFASGTAGKTKKFYNIRSSEDSEWEMEDEAHMKRILSDNSEESIQYMKNRHGEIFTECLSDTTLNKDYSKHPIQVLMKHSIPEALFDEINAYRAKTGSQVGYSASSLFALQQIINVNGESEYIDKFELCKDSDGIAILKSFLECIISKDRMRNDTMMKHVENEQASRRSRMSSIENPLLFIVFLPTHTRNNTIALLQKALKQFLEAHGLWSDYSIEYSNSLEDSGNVKEEYNNRIKTIMDETKKRGKRGCILLLGCKGTLGITYEQCDVTISLDDGHNLDNQKQRFSRALTEAPGKTIGINIDMNIQRTYLYLIDTIQKYRKNTKTSKTNAEILYYLFQQNIFLFDPQQINNGKVMIVEIMTYYQKEVDNMMKAIDDTPFLDEIICDDDMKDLLYKMIVEFNTQHKHVNPELEGVQQDCPKGDITSIQIDAPNRPNEPLTGTLPQTIEEEEQENKALINKTLELCKYLFPYLSLLSKAYRIFDFTEIMIHEKTKPFIVSFLQYKKIELKNNYDQIVYIMRNIISNNEDIVNNILEIYSTAPSEKLRELIAKHFIPTSDEKKQNAEVPTPVILVDNMLDSIPEEFWNTPKKVFEPCCGKGNFVIGIFDRFYKGLSQLYPDEIDRCRIIMTECIYYADISALNVFITTEILKCHIQSLCGIDEFDYKFCNYTGDTLTFDIQSELKISIEDVVVIGNPPYSTDPSKPDSKPLYDKYIEKYINGRLLLFVVPSRWFNGGKGLDRFRKFMMKRKDIVFIRHEDDAKKWFGNNVDIKGGVNYFLKDSYYHGDCLFNGILYNLSQYDCIIKPKYHPIIDIVQNMTSINTIFMGRHYGIETNDSRLNDTGKVKCYVSSLKSKDRCKYVDAYTFNENNTFWKVITAEAAFKAFSGFGEKFIGRPNEIHTGSYISFRVNSEEEAKSLLSYLNTKIANHLLSARKISQHINRDVCKWIPLVPFDRLWTDDTVCEYLKIDKTVYM